MKTKRGYFAIGIHRTKTETNLGTLIRSAYSFGADFVFTIEKRYKQQPSSLKLDKHIPVLHYNNIEDFKNSIPNNCNVIAIELHKRATMINNFKHPERAIYLLGAEDNGLSEEILKGLQIIQLPGIYCLNVSTAGSIVMYDRIQKLT
jgi:tRNA G18 (ribose-2'-O)-methylase SpoU